MQDCDSECFSVNYLFWTLSQSISDSYQGFFVV